MRRRPYQRERMTPLMDQLQPALLIVTYDLGKFVAEFARVGEPLILRSVQTTLL